MKSARTRSPFAKKRSKLSSLGKVLLATAVLIDVVNNEIDQQEAGRRLREGVGLNWSLLTALQFLSGKEALEAINGIPENWEEVGFTKQALLTACLVAAHTVANLRSGGSMLCASELAGELKGRNIGEWLAQRVDVDSRVQDVVNPSDAEP